MAEKKVPDPCSKGILIDLTQVPAMYTQSEGSLQQVQSTMLSNI